MKARFGLALLVAALLATGTVVAAAEGGRTAQEKIAQTNWAAVRGATFIPSYASNTYDIWRHYDHDVFDRELRLVEAVGYNSVRLWLNYSVYEEIGPQMVDRVEDALRLCAKYHLRALIVLFDSCGVRPRKDARWMTASEAYDYFLNSPRLSAEEKQHLQRLFGGYVKGYGKDTLVPVGSDSPIMTILWQNWQSTPGNDRLGPEWYPKLEAYVNALIGRLRNNPNVLQWELMNEPEFVSEGPFTANLLVKPEDLKLVETFLTHFHDYVKQRYPNELFGIGWAMLPNSRKYAHLVDVLNFHVYAEPDKLQQTIDQAVAISKEVGKPILITETLANWDFGAPDFGKLASDEGQLAHYQKVLPVLLKSPIGWMAWGMVISRDFDPFTDIFYPDGHPRPAAVYLEKMLKGAEAPGR
jgi:hypothetical protein